MTRARLLLGSTLGALLVFAVAPYCVGWFSVPSGGIGAVTVAKYPKGFDYFVIIALTVVSAIGAIALSARQIELTRGRPNRVAIWITTAIVFVTMFLIHDHPYAFMDMFHEGEHLTPASVMLDGGRPYRDVFFLHGFATDGGLDALVLGGKPSPKKTRPCTIAAAAFTGLPALNVHASSAFAGAGLPAIPWSCGLPRCIGQSAAKQGTASAMMSVLRITRAPPRRVARNPLR